MMQPVWRGRDLVSHEILYPHMMSMTLAHNGVSTASLSLDAAQTASVRDFIELHRNGATAGFFRVTARDGEHGNGDTVHIALEHGVCVLRDARVNKRDTFKGAAKDALKLFLGYQTAKAGGKALWTLGDAPNDKIRYEYDHPTTLDAVLDVMELLDGYRMEYDMSAIPWKLHIRKAETTPSCEGRLSRNVNNAIISMDESDLCTRVYAPVITDGVMQLEDDPEWGIVEHYIAIGDEVPKEDAEEYCRKYLENRKEPRVSVEVEGLELARETGETLDSFDTGRMMRLALPDIGTVIDERIVTLEFPDMISAPESVRVTLANRVRDASDLLEELEDSSNSNHNSSVYHGNAIGGHASEITSLHAADEGFKEFEGTLTHWFSEAGVDLNVAPEGANVGIFATHAHVNDLFSDVDRRVAQAYVWLQADDNGASSGLVAKVDGNARAVASVTATANKNGQTIVNIQADITKIPNLISESIKAAKAELEYAISSKVSTSELTVHGDGWINMLTASSASIGTLRLKGDYVSKTKVKVVTDFTQASGETADTTEYTILTV